MSNRLLALAWPLRIRPTAKAVLIALADLERDDGRPNYPSIARLCDMTCFSNRAVLDAIDHLVELNLLHADRKAGRQTRYRLKLEPVSEVHNSKGAELSTTGAGASQPPVSEVHNLLSTTSEPGASRPVNLAHEPVNVAPKPVSEVHTTHTHITHKEPESAGARAATQSPMPKSLSNTDSQNPEPQNLPPGYLQAAIEVRGKGRELTQVQIVESFKRFGIAKPGNRNPSDWRLWIDREKPRATSEIAPVTQATLLETTAKPVSPEERARQSKKCDEALALAGFRTRSASGGDKVTTQQEYDR